eukprot:gene8938-biopygen5374
MDELVARITDAAGIGPDLARSAIGIILNFLQKEAPDEVASLIQSIPGATEAIAAQNMDGTKSAGLLGGLMGMMGGGGGLMGLASQLSGAGLGMGDMQSVGHELFAFVREKAGDEAVGQIANAVPGLSQFI